MYGLLTEHEVKMAGCYTKTESRLVNMQRGARIISIQLDQTSSGNKGFIICKKNTFFLRDRADSSK